MVGRNGRKPGNGESIAAAVTEVSERVSLLVREEFELAKAEVTQKVTSIAKGTAAVAAGAVFGVFAVIFALLTLAWGLDAIIVSGAGDIWIGFLIVFGILSVLALASFLFAWRKLKVGAPKPDMAINEAKKIRQTVTDKTSEKPGVTAQASVVPAQPAGPTQTPAKPAVPAQAAVATQPLSTPAVSVQIAQTPAVAVQTEEKSPSDAQTEEKPASDAQPEEKPSDAQTEEKPASDAQPEKKPASDAQTEENS